HRAAPPDSPRRGGRPCCGARGRAECGRALLSEQLPAARPGAGAAVLRPAGELKLASEEAVLRSTAIRSSGRVNQKGRSPAEPLSLLRAPQGRLGSWASRSCRT